MSFNGGVYDEEQAAAFIVKQTKINLATVRQFLEARFRYQELNYLADSDEDLTAERAEHKDLITNSPSSLCIEDRGLVLRYVQKVTGLPVELIARMIAEEAGYMAQLGLVEAACYDDEREWAGVIENGADVLRQAQALVKKYGNFSLVNPAGTNSDSH